MNNKLIGIIVGAVVIILAIFMIVGMVAPQNNSSDHKVTYDGNGGTINGQTQYSCNETNFVESMTATWSGHDFNGWYKDKNCTVKMVNGTKIESDITVYAGWTTNYKLMSGSISIGGAGIFSVVSKTGNVTIGPLMYCTLPDSGTTRIVSTAGSNFEVIKDSSNIECLKFVYSGRSYYATASFTGTTGDVKIGTENDGSSGYFEFSYNADVTLNFRESYYGVGYNANGGTLSDGKTSKYVFNDFTCKSASDLGLTPPAGKTFDGWYTEDTGGTKVEVGSTIPFDISNIIVILYAHYV